MGDGEREGGERKKEGEEGDWRGGGKGGGENNVSLTHEEIKKKGRLTQERQKRPD